MRGLSPPGEAVAEIAARGARYASAGADGLFVPMVSDAATIGAIVRDARLPVNVFAMPEANAVAPLEALGVRRVSVGPKLAVVAYAAARGACRALLGISGEDVDGPLDVRRLNGALARVGT